MLITATLRGTQYYLQLSAVSAGIYDVSDVLDCEGEPGISQVAGSRGDLVAESGYFCEETPEGLRVYDLDHFLQGGEEVLSPGARRALAERADGA